MSMEAHLIRMSAAIFLFSSAGAVYRTPNFVVDAPTESIAKQVGDAAEHYRDELAIEWLGKRLPGDWAEPCTVRVRVGQFGAGGATTFSFDQGHVFGWTMQVQGSLERILDSVLPHEISHTIFASHFRRPLPRWADEGAATLVEHESEKRRQQLTLKQVFDTPRRIPLRKLFTLTEYPREMQNVLTLYAEGYSLTDFLVQRGGKFRFLKFLEDAHRRSWNHALKKYYEFESIESLEKRWNKWVMAGSPEWNLSEGRQLAGVVSANGKHSPAPNVTIRAQNSEANSVAKSEGTRLLSRQRERVLEAPDPRNGSSKNKRNIRVSETGRKPTRLSSINSEFLPEGHGSKAGRLRAINDGWIPITRRRRSTSASLTTNQSPAFRLSKEATLFIDNDISKLRRDRKRKTVGMSVKDSPNRKLPMTDLRVGNDHETSLLFSIGSSAGKTIMQGIRNASPRRSESWSEFPRSRTENSSASLGTASVKAFSPR
jgi:hypothetical protein